MTVSNSQAVAEDSAFPRSTECFSLANMLREKTHTMDSSSLRPIHAMEVIFLHKQNQVKLWSMCVGVFQTIEAAQGGKSCPK